MKIAIVEDQKVEQERLTSYIKTYCQEHNLTVSITCFNDGIDITSDYQNTYDVIYLDVEMAVMDGMTTARKIRQLDPDVLLVFVTNHSQVAIQGYSVEATDFLLKPLSQFVFEEHFKKILRKMSALEEESYLFVKHKSATIKLPQKEIYYLESQGHHLHIHHQTGITTTVGTLKHYETLLDGRHFFRSNSGFIVNLAHVQKVEGNLVFINNEALPISRPRKKDFMTTLTHYVGDMLL